MNAALALALSLAVAVGGAQYVALRDKIAAVRALLDEKREAEAVAADQAAHELNEILQSGLASSLELIWAAYRENAGDLQGALLHWRRIAELRGVNADEILAVRRILCKLGDSLNSWRRLIYEGFPAVTSPEIAPGILALGDSPKGDLRARLLAALVAWEQQVRAGRVAAPAREELRRRLELVRKNCLYEVSACNLLKRLGAAARGVPAPPKNDQDNEPLWLSYELILGKEAPPRGFGGANSPASAAGAGSALGAIDELGELDTVVVLNEGHWEIGLSARGTPLHEEWPIVRLEINGKVIGRTQVNRAEEHEVPFTLDVHRGNIYHLKIVFENRKEDIVQGRIARRGLIINGISFRGAKH
jgi:hypothetical protein